MVLQNKILRIFPVIGYFLSSMVTHNITGGSGGTIRLGSASFISTLRLRNKSIHLPAVYVSNGISFTVGTAGINISRVMVWLNALAGSRVINTDGWHTVLHWDTVSSRESTEVTVKR